MTFEQYKARLKEISDVLERGDITLDESISFLEESVRLSEECLTLLESKKGSISLLKKQLDKLTESPFMAEPR